MKKQYRFFYSILLLFVCLNLVAQKNSTIYGKITDKENNESLGFVTVRVLGSTNGAHSKPNGIYEINSNAGKIELIFSIIGYTEYKTELILKENERKEINVSLDKNQQLKDVVVITGGKYAKKMEQEISSIEVLKPNIIQNTNSKIDESLQKIPGFQLVGETPSVRGGSGYTSGSASKLLVLLDDMPILSPENASVRWELLPTDNIEQVELIKGAASSLYGSSALNGVLNVRTAMPKAGKSSTTFNMNYGFYDVPANKNYIDFWKTKNAAGEEKINRPMLGGFSFSHLQKIGQVEMSEGFSMRTDDSHLMNDKRLRFRNNLRLRWKPKKLDRLTISLNNNAYYETGSLFFIWRLAPNIDKELYSTLEDLTVKATYINTDPILNFTDKKGNLHALKNRFLYNEYITSSGEDHHTRNWYHEYTFSKKFNKYDLQLVAGAMASFVNTNSVILGNRKARNFSQYLQVDKRFFKRLTVSAGYRLEYFSVDSIETAYEIAFIKKDGKAITSPIRPVFKAGFSLEATKGLFIRGSYGEGYRFPTISELFVNTIRSGFHVFANPTLKPESGWNAELGIKKAVKIKDFVGYVDAVGFITRYKNMTDFSFGNYGKNGEYGTITNNVNNAQITGYEISALGTGKIGKVNTSFLLGYMDIKPINLDYDENQPNDPTKNYKILKYRSEKTAKADVELGYKRYTLGASLNYFSFVKQIDDNIQTAILSLVEYRAKHNKDTKVFDTRIGVAINEKAKVFAICKNIFNEEYMYRAGRLEAPRNFAFSLQVKL